MKHLGKLRSYRKGDLEARKARRLWNALIHLQKDPGHLWSMQESNIWASQLAEVATLDRLEDKTVFYPRPRKLHRYRVMVDGHCLGDVSQEVTSSHRKAGRLITRTFHPIEWGYTFIPNGGFPRGGGVTYRTRKSAVQALCYQLVIQEA